jgi:hypothetical protein
MICIPLSVHPEPVEGLPLLFKLSIKKKQGFDKLSPSGVLVEPLILGSR